MGVGFTKTGFYPVARTVAELCFISVTTSICHRPTSPPRDRSVTCYTYAHTHTHTHTYARRSLSMCVAHAYSQVHI